jgi:hypothetical protein
MGWSWLWRAILRVAAWLGLTEFSREFSKTVLYEGILDKAKTFFTERHAEMMAFAATYAIPLAGSGAVILLISYFCFREGRRSAVIAGPSLLSSSLKCAFSPDDPGCVRHTEMTIDILWRGSETYPSFSTIGMSRGGFAGVRVEHITLYRIRVETDREVPNCTARLLTIRNSDREWQIGADLTFAPLEARDKSKTIFPGVPQFVDVFAVSEYGWCKVFSQLRLSNDISEDEIITEPALYTFTIAVFAPNCETAFIDLGLNWTGDPSTTMVSQI